MAYKIYVRERIKVGNGVKQPKFRLVAVTGKDKDCGQLRVEATHLRKNELEQIAKNSGAEIVYLQPIPENERGCKRDIE